MVNYALGKIYRIVSNHTENVYVGSTCRPLSERMAKHRGNYRMHLAGARIKYTSYEILQYDGAEIILIENFPCNNKEELLRRERFHIEGTPNCINLVVPGRTDAEYRAANREKMIEYQKIYRENHQEQAKINKANHYIANREAIKAKHKAYQEANKDEIAEQRKKVIECECGGTVSSQHLARHQKSRKHRDHFNLHQQEQPVQ